MKKFWACKCDEKFPETICVVCVGKLTHYSPWTVYEKAEAGIIPSVPTSRRHRIFLRESVLYWLKNQETGFAA